MNIDSRKNKNPLLPCLALSLLGLALVGFSLRGKYLIVVVAILASYQSSMTKNSGIQAPHF
jgi:hypothetical protein